VKSRPLIHRREISFTALLFTTGMGQIQKINMSLLEDLCENLGVSAQIVPDGMDVLPPQENVKQFGSHQTATLREQQKHLEYVFDMAEGCDEFEDEGILCTVNNLGKEQILPGIDVGSCRE